jgi:hypothetical protein
VRRDDLAQITRLHSKTLTTGRRHDVLEELAVTVMVTYDECEDVQPRMLLHLGSDSETVDVDVSPTSIQARQIAIKLLEAADALDFWTQQALHADWPQRRLLAGTESS